MPITRYLPLLGLLYTGLCVAAPGLPTTPLTLQLKWHHQFQFAGYYAAKEKGFYRDAGLDVEIHEGRPDKDPIDVVLKGEADFGIGASELLLARAEGKPVVALAVILQHSPLILLAKENAGIHSIQNLVGKAIEVVPHEYELFAYIQAMGYHTDDFHLRARQESLDALIANQVAAVSAYSTDEPYLLSQAGIPYIEISPRSAGIDFYGDTLFTREELLEKSPETVSAFRKASIKGWRYAMDHPQEVIDLIIDHYHPEKSRDHLLYEARTMRTLIMPDMVELGYMSRARWQHIADTYTQLQLTNGKVDLDHFIYAARPSNDLQWLYWSSTGALLLALLVGGIAIYILRLNRRLREKEERYRALYESAPVAILVWDRQRRITDWNQQAEQIFGWHTDEVIGRDIFDFLIPIEEVEHVEILIESMFRSEATMASLNWNLTRSGDRILCEWRNTVLHNTNREIAGIVAQAIDVTENKRTDEALRDSERRYRLLAENALDVIWTMDMNGCFTYVSPSVEGLLGFSVEEIMQKNLFTALTAESAGQAEKALQHLLQTGEVLGHEWEMEHHHKNGSTVWTDVIVNVMRNEAGQPQELIGITRDATARRQMERKLQRMAHYDQLTGLPNRTLFFERLDHDLKVAQRDNNYLALLFMDLDGFKDTNDSHGHDVGDGILQEVAKRLKGSIRETDTVARMGGDEFTVILNHIEKPEDSSFIAQKIIAALSAPYYIEGKECRIGTSIGISLYPDDGDNVEALLNLADTAMYAVKQTGKNNYCFHHA